MNELDVQQTVISILSETLGIEEDKITMDSSIVVDLGCWVAMDGIDIVLALQREFNIKLKVQDMENVVTVRSLVYKVESLM